MDPDADSLTYAAESNDTGVVSVSVSSTGNLTIRAVRRGTTTVRVIATDPGGLSATQEFTVEVREADIDPIEDINLGIPSSCPQQVEVCVRDHACEDDDRLRVSVNDAVVFSGTILNRWQCQLAPVYPGNNSIEVYALNVGDDDLHLQRCGEPPTPPNHNSGSLRIRAGSDNREQSWKLPGQTGSRANMNITIGQAGGSCTPGSQPTNNPPTVRASIADVNMMEGQILTYTLSDVFSDPDGDSLSFSATSNSTPHVTVQVSGNRLTVTAVRGFTSGAVTITVTARDQGGLTAQDEFSVTVPQGRRYGVIGVGFLGQFCQDGSTYNIRTGSDRQRVTSESLRACRDRGGVDCEILTEFGSAFGDGNACGALAYGDDSVGCGFYTGTGSTAAAAASAALSTCRGYGYPCAIVRDETNNSEFAVCER